MRLVRWYAAVLAAFLVISSSAHAKTFAELVGDVPVGNVSADGSYELPYILWGGEAATFHANGLALKTKGGSIFSQQGLELTLVPGDNFVQQVRNYLSGKTPFLRATAHMIGLAAEVLGRDPRTQPVEVVQLTWSRGDHVVGREGIRSVADICGKTGVMQRVGPHEGMHYDVVKTAACKTLPRIIYVDDITGPKGPAEKFRADRSVDFAYVVTPDMIGLTGGAGQTGSGAEGTVKDAHIVVSTQELTRSIADVYVVRKDFSDAHGDQVAKFVAGYLKGAEEVVELRKAKSGVYKNLLAFMVKTWGTGALPNADEADGLIADCAFVGHAGNVEFFEDDASPTGFKAFRDASQDLAVSWGYAKKPAAILRPTWDWDGKPFAGYLQQMGAKRTSKFNAEATLADLEALQAGGSINDATIFSFSVPFVPNETTFTVTPELKKKFDEAIQLAAKYGGAALAVRGHADPTKVLGDMVKAGLETGVLERRGEGAAKRYFVSGRELALTSTADVVATIQRGTFDKAKSAKPRELMLAARNLSQQRADEVRSAIVAHASKSGKHLDANQIQAQGVGVLEPLVPVPRSMDDVTQNTRVEFALVRVSAEATTSADFEY
ncbi:MAG: hypothetical protein Q7T01_00375 [bacterium]|nr:hypothetical protein [bacterium]